MGRLTLEAVRELQRQVREHPEDPVVRLTVKGLDDDRLVLSISLEAAAQPGDKTQDCNGRLSLNGAPHASGRMTTHEWRSFTVGGDDR